MADLINSLIACIQKYGALDYRDWTTQEIFMWEEIPEDVKWYIVEESQFTGAIIPDDYIQFTTLLKPQPKEYFLGKYTYMRDSFGDEDYPYFIKYEDGTLINTANLYPEQKIKTTGVLWILGGSGLCADAYYAKNKLAEDDLIQFAGATFWKNGKLIKQ
jgi:hypothetical protein